MSKDYDAYDKSSNIVSMCFPLYCSKIYNSFEELLSEYSDESYKQKTSKQFIGHILIAEDNEANQELIKIILSKYGLTYDLAVNGLEAFEYYKENSYDLILMDEQMPVMNGNEAVQKILNYENTNGFRHIPVSALTANVIKGAKERGILNGFDAFLGKPINIKDLERVFSTYLKASTSNEESNLKLGDTKALIEGLNMKKLRDELLLNNEEILMLVNLFIKKMNTSLPSLHEAIKNKDYDKIQILSHGIKGSSANFRLENLQELASKLENMAKEKNNSYNYLKVFLEIDEIVKGIKIL